MNISYHKLLKRRKQEAQELRTSQAAVRQSGGQADGVKCRELGEMWFEGET